jgi:thiol-disulfide isomerase/thioredoxin
MMPTVKGPTVQEKTVHPLGLEIAGRRFLPIVSAGLDIPKEGLTLEAGELLTTNFDNLTSMAIVVACNSNKNEYVLTGAVPENVENGEFVYMIDYQSDSIIDSTAISNGKFIFRGIIDKAKVIKLSLINEFYADLILDKGNMTIDMSNPYSAKGNILTEKLNEFWLKIKEIRSNESDQLKNIDTSLSEAQITQFRETIRNKINIEIDKLHESYLKEHPNDALGAMIFLTWMRMYSIRQSADEWFVEASQLVGENVLEFGPVKPMAERYKNLAKTAKGMPFVDFIVETGNMDGSSVSFSDYVGKGKYVLVDFWASWCAPCRMEAPVIDEVYQKYKGDKFEVLGVAVYDKREETLKAIAEDGNSWPQIIDAQDVPLNLYGISGIPHIILFGPDGTILERGLRGNILKDKIAEVMK